MYYIRHDHVALVSEELWEKAQQNPKQLAGSPVGKTTSGKKITDFSPSISLQPVPALNSSNYPYKDRIFCKYCGSHLRRIIARNRSVWWICNGLSRKGKAFCTGVRIPDEKLYPLRNLNYPVYIGKENINGKETYGYSPKPDKFRRETVR